MIVVDSNVVLYLLIEGDHTSVCEVLYGSDPEWIAPSNWRVEFLNVLSTYCRAKRMSVAKAVAAYEHAVKIVREMPFDVNPSGVLELSERSGCSGYDCMFVVAAKMNSLPLVTFDQQLLKAFPETAVLPDAVENWFQNHRPK